MIETYQHEISQKRRASRIFWAIVFIFAGFLFFFFQGYYPAIDFSFRSIFLTGGVRNYEPKDIIKSFGIINVSVKPKDATILLGSGTYSNDEKRMTNYGKYTLSINKAGYISSTSNFDIDRETPYYIDILTLLPRISYQKIGTNITSITKIDDDIWSAHTASGMVRMDSDFSGISLTSSGFYTSIGEGYFLSGNTLLEYNTSKELWEKKTWSGSINFITICKGNIIVKEGKLWCPDDKKILTEKGITLTGVISLGKNSIRTSRGIIPIENLSQEIIFGSGRTITKDIFIEKEGSWYTPKGGDLIEISNTGAKQKFTPTHTRLDEIEYVEWIDGILTIIGKKNGEYFLTFSDPKKEEISPLIPFPNIALEEVRIEKRDGNLFFKTKGALLFLYHNNTQIEWLIDGDILAFGKNAALYIRDNIIWKASWKGEE